MSLHSSLKIDIAGAQQRSVLTRIERIKELMKKGLWEQTNRANGLPKTKIVRIKTRKAKAEKAEGAEAGAAAGAAAPAAGAAKPAAGAPAAKPAAGAKK